MPRKSNPLKNRLPFKKDSKGSIVQGMTMLTSGAYMSLSAQEKVALIVMQIHWRNDRAVSYGCRELALNVPCSKDTALKIFRNLSAKGFIECTDPGWFDSANGSRSRDWRLTWMPFNGKPATDEWIKWTPEN